MPPATPRCSPWGLWWIIIADANGLTSRNVANRSMSSGVPVLCDGIAVRDHGVLHSDQTIDVLSPFAGGVTVIYVTSRKGHELATARLNIHAETLRFPVHLECY